MRLFWILLAALMVQAGFSAEKPNIVWIVGEDMGPELGCYGDKYAITPTIDKLASESARFSRAFTHAPVCAPARSGLITGRYPTSIGTHHMRSTLLRPPAPFTRNLREAGYTVFWPGKTDFNFAPPTKDFDSTANWLTKPPPKQPFFAYINFGDSHESQIRANPQTRKRLTARLKPHEFHDPAKVTLPPYYPGIPEVRRDLANYYDLVTAVDYKVSDVLRYLDTNGLSSNTVVFFFGDHGRGLPRSKRWVYDSGIHVPLMVRWPGHIKPGSVREDLVSFIDFAPTVLSIAGVPIPKDYDGHAFLGAARAPERKYIFAARDRMDETYDRIRAVRDKRFKYIRNYHPELPYAQEISYGELMPTMQVWRKKAAEGELNDVQKLFFAASKPKEELYDIEADPHEVKNLASNPAYKDKLAELRKALDEWTAKTGDLGAVPETELIKRGLVADRLKEYEPRKQRSN